MKTKLTSMKTQLTTLYNGTRTCAMTEPVAGRKPVLALLMRLLWAAALVLPAFGAQAAVVFTNLYLFGSVQDTNGVPLDGVRPDAGLVQGSDGYFYGTTGEGGTNQMGTVFKISTNGMLTSFYSFGSVQDTNGVPLDGSYPQAGLVQGSDGYFYGTTGGGGTSQSGTVFKISTNGALTTLYSFSGNDGAGPVAGLVQGSDGSFYGTTANGGTTNYNAQMGADGYGTVFRITTNGMLTSLYSFTGTNDGGNPQAGLVQGSDGSFYGTTAAGGTSQMGTVFKISTNGMLTSFYSFGSVQDTNGALVDGAGPSGLVQGSDGYFYGTTSSGGIYDILGNLGFVHEEVRDIRR
jgi:uncharacterized repeat protein (TIGR03803 family)